jgi:putative endonuclease
MAPIDPRHRLGRLGEDLAAAHLEGLGFAILARNARTRHGEIDLVAFDGSTLVFAEVKTARQRDGPHARRVCGGPLERLAPRQRARLRRLACAWLRGAERSRPRARAIRFDAIGVLLDHGDRLMRLDHLEGAW